METFTDGMAVNQVRTLLARQGVADPTAWRSTVVQGDEDGA